MEKGKTKYRVLKDFKVGELLHYKMHLTSDDVFLDANSGEVEFLLLNDYIEKVEEVKEPEAPKSWEDLEVINGWVIDCCSNVNYEENLPATYWEKKVFATENQAKSALAQSQLSQLMAHEAYNGDWKAVWDTPEANHVIDYYNGYIDTRSSSRLATFLAFRSQEIRDQFLKDHRELIEEYFLQYQ